MDENNGELNIEQGADAEHRSEVKHRSLIKAFGYAFEGIAYSVRTQHNMRIHLVIAVCVLIISIFLRLTPLEWAIILICIGLVIMTEMLNTAIEAIVDLVSPEYHNLAKVSKDLGAGMVVIFASLSAVVGSIVFAIAILRIWG